MSNRGKLNNKRCGTEPLNGDSVLHKCARSNSASGTENASSTGPVDGTNNRKETAIIVVAQNTACRAMAALIRLGADINHQDYKGNTALHYAVWAMP
jgi:ankyrin repeat protein